MNERSKWAALSQFRNPWLLVLDRLGWRRRPYVVTTRKGARIQIRPGTGDRFTAFEMFGVGVYDEGLAKLKMGDVVVDIGANIGCFSVAASGLIGSSGTIVAVEPEERTHKCLVENFERNKIAGCAAVRGALARRNGTLELYVPKHATLFTSMFREVDGRPVEGAIQRVNCMTLDELLQTHGIEAVALLKLDCEGAEHEIIVTLSVSTALRIANIIIEFHRVPGSNQQDSIETLKSLGYKHSVRHNHLFSR